MSQTAARFPLLLVAGATAVVIGSGFTFAGLRDHAENAALDPAAAPAAVAPPADLDTGDLLPSEPPVPSSAAPASPAPTSAAPTSKPPAAAPTSKPPRVKQSTTSKPRPRPTSTRTTTAASEPRPEPPATGDAVTDAVLAHINDARRDEGLRALTLDTNLSRAAAAHNQEMIDGCGLSHRCPGEADLGDRFSAQGVQWRSAGENIGFGSAGSSNAAMIGAANGLTDSMLAEVPPEDGHRRNLLSTGFTRIGLSVVRADGRVWFTQDFVG